MRRLDMATGGMLSGKNLSKAHQEIPQDLKDVFMKERQNRKKRSGVHGDIKSQHRLLEAAKTLKKHQVAGTRDWKELGQPLNHPQDDRLQKSHQFPMLAIGPMGRSLDGGSAGVSGSTS
jgi:hypothetical protein